MIVVKMMDNASIKMVIKDRPNGMNPIIPRLTRVNVMMGRRILIKKRIINFVEDLLEDFNVFEEMFINVLLIGKKLIKTFIFFTHTS